MRAISIRIYADKLVMAAKGQHITEHPRLFGSGRARRGHTQYDWYHYLSVLHKKLGALRNGAPFAELPPAFKKLQSILLQRPGGDRDIVEILALVLHHDEGAVLSAVELIGVWQAIEGGCAYGIPNANGFSEQTYLKSEKSVMFQMIIPGGGYTLKCIHP